LFKTAEKLVKEGDKDGAVVLLKRALELDPNLELNPKEEIKQWANSVAYFPRI
jgi:Tfp pilus assembly protein PilF